MLASNETALRSFFGRFLGWADECRDEVEHAVRSAELAATHRAALVLLAETDFVSIALALHRVTRGASAPFVVCDPQCRDTPASARLPGNHASGVAALRAAAGGSLCLRSWRLPLDFVATVVRARDLAFDVRIIICAEERHLAHPFLIRPVPIWVPSLQTRRAAERLGIAEVTLRSWIKDRELPPILHDPELRRELEASFADGQEDDVVDTK